ncbi:MAG TPA: helix-turn-helix domain-containing protein [Paraburkholderia sp.]|nr:helix-turn-helix domain-containing protein [Paraburkholderia sp.]
MNATGTITMTMREVERFKVIEAVVEGRLRCFQAAERLQLGVRQIGRLCRPYEAAGPAGLVSAKRGRPGNRELSVDLRARAMPVRLIQVKASRQARAPIDVWRARGA